MCVDVCVCMCSSENDTGDDIWCDVARDRIGLRVVVGPFTAACLSTFFFFCFLRFLYLTVFIIIFFYYYSDDGALCSKANRHVQSLGCASGDGGEYLKQWSKMQQPLCCYMENRKKKQKKHTGNVSEHVLYGIVPCETGACATGS